MEDYKTQLKELEKLYVEVKMLVSSIKTCTDDALKEDESVARLKEEVNAKLDIMLIEVKENPKKRGSKAARAQMKLNNKVETYRTKFKKLFVQAERFLQKSDKANQPLIGSTEERGCSVLPHSSGEQSGVDDNGSDAPESPEVPEIFSAPDETKSDEEKFQSSNRTTEPTNRKERVPPSTGTVGTLKDSSSTKHTQGNNMVFEKRDIPKSNPTIEEDYSEISEVSSYDAENAMPLPVQHRYANSPDTTPTAINENSFVTDAKVVQLEGPGMTESRPHSITSEPVKSPEKRNVATKTPKDLSMLYVAVRDWTGEKGDLSFEAGDQMHILEKNEDGWWLARDTSGRVGLVPMNFLRESSTPVPVASKTFCPVQQSYVKMRDLGHIASAPVSTFCAKGKENVSSSESSGDERFAKETNEHVVYQTLMDRSSSFMNFEHAKPLLNNAQSASSDSKEEVDKIADEESSGFKNYHEVSDSDNDNEVNDNDKVDGEVECALVGLEMTPSKEDESGSEMISKSTARRPKQTALGDIKSLGPLPSGVAVSSLASVDESLFNYQFALAAKLGASGLLFVDPVYDPVNRKAKRRVARVQQLLYIRKCSWMPTFEKSGVTIMERTARVCISDGRKPVSNIICIPLRTSGRKNTVWLPRPHCLRKAQREVPTEIFVRYNTPDARASILLEVGVTVRKPEGNQEIELSVGWITLPLYTADGSLLRNRSAEYALYPGTPFEANVSEQQTNKEFTLLQKVQNLISNQPPRIALRIAQPSKEQLDPLGCLPETLIGLTAYLPFISMHRDLLAAQIYGNAMTSKIGSIPTCTVPPLVAMFPNVADSPLLIEALRVSWSDRVSELATESKKDYEELKRVYEDHFNTSVYPLACLSDRIPAGFISSQLFQRERPRILALLKSAQSDPVAFFASPEYSFHPYTLQESTFPVKLNA